MENEFINFIRMLLDPETIPWRAEQITCSRAAGRYGGGKARRGGG